MAALALAIATAGYAQDKPQDKPQDKLADHEHGSQGARKGRAAEHVERAGDELKEASKTAKTEARHAAHEARERAQGALHEASENARAAMEEARAKTRAWLEEAREQTRQALLSAASGLESKASKEERDQARVQRRDRARVEQWRKLRHHMHDDDAHAAVITPEMRGELSIHANRTARLARIRALAAQANDTKTVERCDELLQLELKRHDQHVSDMFDRMRAHGSADAKPAAAGERKTP